MQVEKNSIALKKVNGNPRLFSYPFGQPETCYTSETDEELKDLGIEKIFYANIMENKSFIKISFYRLQLKKDLISIYEIHYIFKPFYNQFKTKFKNKN